MKRLILPALTCLGLFATAPSYTAAAENWFEIKSPHFTVWTSANDGHARTLVWQLEQVRSAMTALWPWAKVDLPKQTLVFAVKEEKGIKALAPEYWETKGAVRPVSVSVSGADRHYMVIRTDVQGDDTFRLNPFTSTYFTYAALILQSSFDRRLPLWFQRGLAGVFSNTLVRENEIRFGVPIPWHLETLRRHGRLSLKQLVGVTRSSPEYTQGLRLAGFDAECWAFVHFLMFSDDGARRQKINRFAELLRAGKEPDAAFADAMGRIEDFDTPFLHYIDRSIYSYQIAKVDAGVARERFVARPIPLAEAAAGRAIFHVAMGRATEARTLVTQARNANPNEPDAHLAEALQLDRDGKEDEAKVAYARAAELGSSNAYGLYRGAVLNWPHQDRETLLRMEKALARAVELNPSFASAYASLGEVRALLHQPSATVMPLIAKAVSLEPFEFWHRLTAARVLLDLESPDEALKTAEVALRLADTDRERDEAQKLLASIRREQEDASRQSVPARPAASDTAKSNHARSSACQSGDPTACRELFPIAERACAEGQREACVAVAAMQIRGAGTTRDEARGLASLEQLCREGLMEGCTQLAVTFASQPKPNLTRARQLLTTSCDKGFAPACEMLKLFPKDPSAVHRD